MAQPARADRVNPRVAAGKAVREGTVNNLTNPKPMLFMLVFLPQFVDPTRGDVTAQFLVLGLSQKLSGLAVLASVAAASGALGVWLARRPGVRLWQERCTGLVLVLLGLRMLFSGDGGPAKA
jgi:threonine/homoserine/homoserine lactone efflux protein